MTSAVFCDTEGVRCTSTDPWREGGASSPLGKGGVQTPRQASTSTALAGRRGAWSRGVGAHHHWSWGKSQLPVSLLGHHPVGEGIGCDASLSLKVFPHWALRRGSGRGHRLSVMLVGVGQLMPASYLSCRTALPWSFGSREQAFHGTSFLSSPPASAGSQHQQHRVWVHENVRVSPGTSPPRLLASSPEVARLLSSCQFLLSPYASQNWTSRRVISMS